MAKQPNRACKGKLLFSPHSPNGTGLIINEGTMHLPNRMLNMDDMIHSSNPRRHSYAEITYFDRTTRNTALQQIHREVEGQLNRLKNLNNKEFVAEMDVIKHNLSLDDAQMVSLILMTLREVPIRHRNCTCTYVLIKQKHSHCLFTTPTQPIVSVSKGSPSSNTSIECDAATPPTPSTPDIKVNKYTALQLLFTNQDIQPLTEAHPINIKPMSQSSLPEYIDTVSTLSTNSQPSNYNTLDEYIEMRGHDTAPVTPNINVWLNIAYTIRDVVLFVIPFIHSMISSSAALIVFLEVTTGLYDDNTFCNTIHDMFYGAKIDNVLSQRSICFYLILMLRMSTILCWYILLMHSLVFRVVSCWCCRNTSESNDYYLMSTVMLNSSVSIEEHLRSQSRNVTSLNLVKFYLRMVVVPNTVAILVEILLFDEENAYLSLSLDICVLFAFYWSLSDWFYFDKENVLVSWRDVYVVVMIDAATNWIKYVTEIINYLLFLVLCIAIAVPFTIFVLLRIVFCPYLFGYNNTGCLMCNLFETVIEYILKTIQRCYV
eukprot:77969_1